MMLSRLMLLLFLAAAFALLLALGSQYIGGYHPCELCIYQRVPFVLLIVIYLLSVIPVKMGGLIGKVPACAGMTICLLAGTAIAAFHFGVEQKWWEGFSACSGTGGGGSIDDLRAQIMAAATVRCDEPTWFLFGLSMAGWNFLYSGALTLLGIFTLIKNRKNVIA